MQLRKHLQKNAKVCGGCFKETVEWIVSFLSIMDVLYMLYYFKKINAIQ